MAGSFAAYVTAICTMLFAGVSALTLIYTVEHLDPPKAPSPPEEVPASVAV